MMTKKGYVDKPIIASDRKMSQKHATHSFLLNHGHATDHFKGEVKSIKRVGLTNPKKAQSLAKQSVSDLASMHSKMSKYAGISSNLKSAQQVINSK